MSRYAVRLTVAALVAATVGLGVSGPAQASTCGSADGVSVVVDFHQLGGGVQSFCDAGGAGKTADAQLRDAGHALTYVQRQPGFICRIDGKPADDPCVNTPPADAYWSLWWSDGKSGTWTYASQGSATLKVPQGGYVGMSWQGQAARAAPGTAPTAHPSKPSSGPTSGPSSSPHPSTRPSQAPPSSGSPRATNAPSDAASSPPGKAGKKQQQHRSKAGQAPGKSSPGNDSTQSGEALGPVTTSGSDDSGGSGSGGLPGWVAPVAVVVLFGGAGTIALLRRKSRGGT